MDKRVRNVIIAADYGDVRGGQEKVAIESAIALSRAGYRVSYFCGAMPIDPRLAASGVNVDCLEQLDIFSDPSRFSAIRRGLWNAEAKSRLESLVRSSGVDRTVLHIHGWNKILSPSMGRVLRDTGVRTVYTMHEYFLACPNGGFFDYKANEICVRTPLGVNCLLCNCDQRNFGHKLFRIARQNVLHRIGSLPVSLKSIIYISELQRSVMQRYLPAQAELTYVPNPIMVDKEIRAKAELSDVFLFVGRLSAAKGAVVFAQAALAAGVRAVFLGSGSESEEILKANPYAELVGWVDSPDVAQWIRRARALVFPSLWYECQPLVPLEALACGVPVVAFDCSAACNSIRHKQNGLIVPVSGKSQSMKAALEELKVDALVHRMSEAAYQSYWEDPLTIERHIGELSKVYART